MGRVTVGVESGRAGVSPRGWRSGARLRVLVTGGLGFVGSHLCLTLRARGFEVTAVDCLRSSYLPPAGPAALARFAEQDICAVRLLDLRRCDVERLVAGHDCVVHLAALPGVRQRATLGELWQQNVAVTAGLVAACARLGKRIVFASSSSVYGDAPALPTPEDAPLAPQGLYAASKAAAEGVCRQLHRSRGADVVIVRLFTVFGPGQRPDMAISRWIAALLRDEPLPWSAPSGARRELTVVEDACEGIAAALERGVPGRTYNIPGCGSVALEDLVPVLERLTGRKARTAAREQHPADVLATAACGERARLELGFAPRRSLLDGLARQVAALAADLTAAGARSRRQRLPLAPTPAVV